MLACGVPWPVCPKCTRADAANSGTGWRCEACGHCWPGPPIGAPCARAATHVATDKTGSVLVCDPHAAMAHRLLPNAKISKLSIQRKEIPL